MVEVRPFRFLQFLLNFILKEEAEMEELVFRSGKEDLFTTSEVIAQFAGVQHHTVTRLIQQHEED